MSYRKTSRAGTIKGSASSLGSVVEKNLDQPGLSAEATPVEAPPKKSQKSSATKETAKNEGKRKLVAGESKIQQPFIQPSTSHTESPKVGEFIAKVVKSPQSPTKEALDFSTLLCQQVEGLKALILQGQAQVQDEVQELRAQTEARFRRIEESMSEFVPVVDERFNTVEHRIIEDEVGSQASMVELQKVREDLQQEREINRGKEAAQDQEIQSIEEYIEQNQVREQAYKAELEAKIERLTAENQAQQNEIEKLKRLNWGVPPPRPVPPPIITERGEPSHAARPGITTTAISAGGDVIMTDAYPYEYERGVPKFDGKGGDVKIFVDRLNRYFGRHEAYYSREPQAKLYFIEDHLEGDALKWYRMDEQYAQMDNPQPQRLLERLLEEFKSERPLAEVKNQMLKLRHEWGKAYEYLAEFNRLSRILQLPDTTRKLLMVQQVRPSIRERFYDLPPERTELQDYVKCLRECDAFPSTYRKESLERSDSPRERKIACMALLGIMDPRRPSIDIEARKKKQAEGPRNDRKEFKKRDYGNNSYREKENQADTPKNNYKENTPKYGGKGNFYKDNRTSSNNPLPKSALAIHSRKSNESNVEFVPEATIENLRTNQQEKGLEVLYDTGSDINMIHPQLAKDMGFEIINKPCTFTTAAGKAIIPQVTEEFKLRIKLIDEVSGEIKWYEYATRCRLSDAMPKTVVLGSKFMDRHLIYRKIDTRDHKPKVYKMKGDVIDTREDKMEQCMGESIYMVQETAKDENQNVQQPKGARITRLVEEIIHQQKYKDTVNDLIKQFYHDRGIEYAGDYYDDLIEFDKWQKKEETSSNPRHGNRLSSSCTRRLHC